MSTAHFDCLESKSSVPGHVRLRRRFAAALEADPRFVGCRVAGFFGVLHTLGRPWQYHPHLERMRTCPVRARPPRKPRPPRCPGASLPRHGCGSSRLADRDSSHSAPGDRPTMMADPIKTTPFARGPRLCGPCGGRSLPQYRKTGVFKGFAAVDAGGFPGRSRLNRPAPAALGQAGAPQSNTRRAPFPYAPRHS
jgi:hypothetical protein